MSLLAKVLGGVAGQAIGIPAPVAAQSGDVFYKGLRKAAGFFGKIVKRKTDKAERKMQEQAQRLAQLKTLDFAGTANSGTDLPSTPAQKAVFGLQASEKRKPSPLAGVMPDFQKINVNNKTENNMESMEWVKKNWYYLAGGAAVLYFLMGKKRR